MKITVCSGKGGTGKTTIATSLAQSLVGEHEVWYIDCDVEAPNGHIFLKPEIKEHDNAITWIPLIHDEKCTACGRCVSVCQFHALAMIGSKVLVFPQLCHGCGSCTWNCPEGAIEEQANIIGVLEAGNTESGIVFSQGELTISEPMPTPIIRQLKKWHAPQEEAIVILDAPPGASCSVVETLRGSDFALIVTEPTPFGLHDLKQVLGIIEDFKMPAGVIINRDGIGNNTVEEYLLSRQIPILMRVPFSRDLAEGLSAGRLMIDILPGYQVELEKAFSAISDNLKKVQK